ncbi:MAG: hydroxymethylbilane synthase [Burkholderiaceae bacterium]|jgi:hydroxymethylbilane synthase|nr:hydroxymethylbilane synthase [Pseudomonadota bacterium]MDP4669343.1 hydroxymethylbilane synthase [Burkholderiaceae bacterium]
MWIIASRESRLALWQAEHVAALLTSASGQPVSILGMTTRGDQILDRTLSKVGGKGLFVKELETALEEGRAHLAVHSLKDVPMELPEGFELATVMAREDPRDALVSSEVASLDDLPAGAIVGTSSLRREAQLRARYPSLQIVPLRGNLDTRLAKLDRGDMQAIILAAAGLKRLGLANRIRQVIPPEVMLPAAGQGALGIEIRAGDSATAELVSTLADQKTFLEVRAERAVSRALGGSCQVPLAAYCVMDPDGKTLFLRARVGMPDGSRLCESNARGVDPEALGRRVAQDLRDQGASEILAALEA